MLDALIKTVKDYKKLGLGYNEERMNSWIKIIEKGTGLKIEKVLE